MKRAFGILLAVAIIPAGVSGQQSAAERIEAVLPPDVAARVVAHLESLDARELPSAPVVNLVFEGVSKGHDADAVLAAVDALVEQLAAARAALTEDGRPASPSEVEAAATVLRMGVSGSTISDLARNGPSGRSLAVPLLVLGSLAQSGMPAAEALAAVQARLSQRVGDAELVRGLGGGPAGLGGGLGRGGGDAIGGAAGQGPPVGSGAPAGPPEGVGRPSDAPGSAGRGRGAPPGGDL